MEVQIIKEYISHNENDIDFKIELKLSIPTGEGYFHIPISIDGLYNPNKKKGKVVIKQK